MRLAAVSLASLLSIPAAWGQVVESKTAEPDSKMKGESKPKLADDEHAAMLKKKFLACKASGDCASYLLEKEKYKKNKPKKEIPEDGAFREPAVESNEEPAEEAGGEASPPPPSAPGEPAGTLVPLEAAGGSAPRAPAPTAAQAEVLRRDAGARRERTMSRASGAADAMRRSFFPADEAPPGKDGAPERRAAPAPEAASAKAASFSGEPRTVPELALASRSGFAATFREQGLKVGAGPRGEPAIQRADGAPASEADLARLREALRSDPAALRRRPDFFDVLPRGKFADLKQDFTARPELRGTAFKDIGMTAQARDFQWSASCSGLSGACNPHAAAGSYRKGQDVPPEDLDAVWSAVQEEIFDEEEEEGFGEYTEEDRRLAAAEDLAAEKLGSGRARGPSLASLLVRMGELARGLGDGVRGSPAGAYAASEPAGGPGPAAAGGGQRPAGRPVAAVSAASPRAPGPPPPPEGRRTAERRTGAFALAAVIAAALLLRGLRKA